MSKSTSSKRRRREKAREPLKSCPASGGKLRYTSRKRALTAMNHLRGNFVRRTLDSLPKAVYRCEACGDWHLTSREPRP